MLPQMIRQFRNTARLATLRQRCQGARSCPWTPSLFASNHTQHFSSSSRTNEEVILFQRSPSSDNLILKSGILTASFHSAYWIWYITDFIPLVNGSDMPELHIDPMLGWTGFVFAVAIQTMVMVYPKRLVSTLALVTPNNSNAPSQLLVYTYSLLVKPATVPNKYKVGELTLDPRSTEVQQLLTECRGNAQLFRGRLGITANNSRIPFLLEVKRDKDVPEPQLLIQALLSDKDTPKQQRAISRDSQPSLTRPPKHRRGGGARRKR